MEKILVTGGAGFIGSNFVRFLFRKRRKVQITVLDKLTYAGNMNNLEGLLDRSDFKFVKGDICNKKLLDELLAGKDIVYNFAAETHVDRSILKAGSFVKTDVVGTYTLLQGALKHKLPRFVQISTDEVYGSIREGKFHEDDPLKPNSPYSASKSGADLLVRAFHKTYGMPAVITRSSNNYGPYQHPEKFIPLFITNAIEGNTLPLYGDGMNVRDWIYVEDNCAGIDLVGRKGRVGTVYNIGAGEEMPNIAIAKKIIELVGADDDLLTMVSDRPGHDRRYALDTRRLKALGWRKRLSFGEGLSRTVRWYMRNESWWKPIKGGVFKKYYSELYRDRIRRSHRKGMK
ncbi:MAG: dTDP-glucose 4,6-dehydratase [Candidatus Krumholzibacteria bacterium]|nr:dTDP-glucose 4,6-dehydratase [Candidatus Krumholzibacteria bacterium]